MNLYGVRGDTMRSFPFLWNLSPFPSIYHHPPWLKHNFPPWLSPFCRASLPPYIPAYLLFSFTHHLSLPPFLPRFLFNISLLSPIFPSIPSSVSFSIISSPVRSAASFIQYLAQCCHSLPWNFISIRFFFQLLLLPRHRRFSHRDLAYSCPKLTIIGMDADFMARVARRDATPVGWLTDWLAGWLAINSPACRLSVVFLLNLCHSDWHSVCFTDCLSICPSIFVFLNC